jgi:hypothetical protein
MSTGVNCTLAIYHHKWTIQRNWQHRVHNLKGGKKHTHNTICVCHHYAQANTNNVNKTWALLQTSGGNYETNIVSMQWHFFVLTGSKPYYKCSMLTLTQKNYILHTYKITLWYIFYLCNFDRVTQTVITIQVLSQLIQRNAILIGCTFSWVKMSNMNILFCKHTRYTYVV